VAKEKTYSGITEEIWERIKVTTEAEHKTIYSLGNPGTATTETVVGQLVLEYKFDTAEKNLQYKILKKPFLATEAQIWDTLDKSIQNCLPVQ
jgi:hypothetical protein